MPYLYDCHYGSEYDLATIGISVFADFFRRITIKTSKKNIGEMLLVINDLLLVNFIFNLEMKF